MGTTTTGTGDNNTDQSLGSTNGTDATTTGKGCSQDNWGIHKGNMLSRNGY